MTIDRGRQRVLLTGSADCEPHEVVAMRARELGRAGIAVGDRVGLVGDVSGAPGTLARIVRIEPRQTVLRRSADDVDPVERVIVANADQLVVVASTDRPAPRPRLVDRCLAAAFDAGMQPVLCLTKGDLGDARQAAAPWEALALPTLVVSRNDRTLQGVEAVRERLSGRDSVLVGPSGVGKSTLVNALVRRADRATGSVNATTGQGRHTSSSAIALPLDGADGWVTDTPGVRSFGLAHLDPSHLVIAFGDLLPGTQECPRGCSHDEAECGLDDFVASGAAGPGGGARLSSLRRLLRSRAGGEAAGDEEASGSL